MYACMYDLKYVCMYIYQKTLTAGIAQVSQKMGMAINIQKTECQLCMYVACMYVCMYECMHVCMYE